MDLNRSQTWRFNHHRVTAGQCWDRVPQNGVKRWSPWSNYSDYAERVTRRIANGIWNVMNWINFEGFLITVTVKQTWNLFAFLHDRSVNKRRGNGLLKGIGLAVSVFTGSVPPCKQSHFYLFLQRICALRKYSACKVVRLAVAIYCNAANKICHSWFVCLFKWTSERPELAKPNKLIHPPPKVSHLPPLLHITWLV